MSEAEELSEKRAAAARKRWAGDPHPLFLYEPGESPQTIAWINVRRYGLQGMAECPRVWPAGELASEEEIYGYWGGGTFELLGRGALANGQPGPILKRRTLRLDGASKPFSGELAAASGAVAVAAPSAADPMSPYLMMMAEDRREARAREERRDAEMRAADERRQARDEERARASTTLLVQGLQVVASIVATVINRPAPLPPAPGPDLMPLLAQLIPKPDSGDALEKLGKVLEIAEKVKGGKETESLGELMAGFGQAAAGIAEMQRTAPAGSPAAGGRPLPLPGQAPQPQIAPTHAPAAHAPASHVNGNGAPYVDTSEIENLDSAAAS